MCPIERFGVLEAKREEEFAPVKNASGDSSPETARLLYSNNDRKILEGKGVKFEGDGLVEIDQKKTYLGENLEIGNLKE